MVSSDFYLKAVTSASAPEVAPGASGYFSAPQANLDPRLFDGEHLKPAIRNTLLHVLYSTWSGRYRNPKAWSTAWLAGSGISYQWAANRGNGDLDVLIGVDFAEFYYYNPDYRGHPEDEMADIFNRELKEVLWPQMANWNGFEVTFYVNPHSQDIRNLHPYAAYSLTDDSWTVHPPHLPQDPRSLYGPDYWKAVEGEKEQALSLISRYRELAEQAAGMQYNSPGWRNVATQQSLVVGQARSMFDDIHLGRRNAFSPTGKGYGDYYNFRWQAHKEAGTMQALASLAKLHQQAHEAASAEAYGGPIDDARTALVKAAMHRRTP